MRRLLLSAGLSLAIHGLLLLGTDAAWMKRGRVPIFSPEPLALTLADNPLLTSPAPSMEDPPIIEKSPAPIQSGPEKEDAVSKAPEKTPAPVVKPAIKKPPKPVTKPEPFPPEAGESPAIKEEEAPSESLSDAGPLSGPETSGAVPGPGGYGAGDAPGAVPGSGGHGTGNASGFASVGGGSAGKGLALPLREAFPAYRKNPSPGYPMIARRRAYQGTVVMDVLVNRRGRVEELRLSQSSGYAVLDSAAMEAVRGWVFEPGRRGDEEIDMWVKVPIRFELR